MSEDFVFQFFNFFKNDRYSLAYMGGFDDELTATLMRINETSAQEPNKFKKKLSFLIAECFQNIIRHGDKPEIINRTNNKPNIFILRNIENEHYISSSNLISNKNKEDLEEKIKSINTLSPEKLKEVYLNALATNEISEKGGGGLGLIEMARKSGFPIDFSFDFVNFYHSIFYMQVHFVAKLLTTKIKNTAQKSKIGISETKALYNKMLDENILMIRKGDFSQESILPLIELIETNLKLETNFSGSKKKMMYLLVELLQNISKHGIIVNQEHEGIFIIQKQNKNYILSTGNYIDSGSVEPLKSKLRNITAMNKEELIELYKSTLLSKEPSSSRNAGIGIIEMCKYSKEKIKYNFNFVSESISFFSISVTV